MSTCPEIDIHSVYLDGELPEKFIPEYEAHVKTCPSCKKLQDEFRSLANVFSEDRKSIAFSKTDLDKSFERLQAKMSYSSYLASQNAHTKKINYSSIKYFASGLAAALVVAAVIPVTIRKPHFQTDAQFVPVSRRDIISPASQVSYGNEINPMSLNPILAKDSFQPENISYQGNNFNGTGAYHTGPRPPLYSYDVFIPEDKKSEFQEKTNGFSFTISSPFVNISLEFGN